MNKLKLGIAGSGYLAEIIIDSYINGLLSEYEMVGIYGRNTSSLKTLSEKAGCKTCNSLDELLKLEPDYIAEAASIAFVKESAQKILEHKCNFVVLSIGAFADESFLNSVKNTASENGKKIYLASGAIGGFDVLRTISLMGNARAEIRTEKGPGSLMNTPVFKEDLMSDTKGSEVFSGSAKEAIALFPTKVNVAVAASLATAGPEQTHVSINSIPGMTGDDHKITAETEGVKAVVDIYSSTSAIAGWSVVALLRNIVSPIVM